MLALGVQEACGQNPSAGDWSGPNLADAHDARSLGSRKPVDRIRPQEIGGAQTWLMLMMLALGSRKLENPVMF